ALAAAAQAQGIQIGRSQVRRILRQEGVRWRRTHSWGSPTAKGAKDFAPKARCLQGQTWKRMKMGATLRAGQSAEIGRSWCLQREPGPKADRGASRIR